MPHSDPKAKAPQRRHRLLYVCIAIVVAIGAILIATRLVGEKHAEKPTESAPAPSVTVTSPRQFVWPEVFRAQGAIQAWQEASIGAQIGGYRVTEVLVNAGDQVRKDQVLARLNPALIEADVAQLQASCEQADGNRRRALALKKSGAISDQDILKNITDAKTAAGRRSRRSACSFAIRRLSRRMMA